MKSFYLTIITIILLTVLLSAEIFPQNSFSIGAYIGGGVISGNSPNEGSYTASVFVETDIEIIESVYPRLSFIYAADFNSILPNTRERYFPFLKGVSLKGITSQYFENKIFLEEGIGALVLNDRTFSDTDVWNYGIALSMAAGFDLRDFNLKGFKLGLGAEYGLTFNNTLAKYFSLHLQVHYLF